MFSESLEEFDLARYIPLPLLIVRESLHDLVTSYEMYNDADLKTILK